MVGQSRLDNIPTLFQLPLNFKEQNHEKIGLSVLLISIVQSGFAVDPVTSASFKVQATIENGCKLSNVEQLLDFGRHPVVAQGQLKDPSLILRKAGISNVLHSYQ